MAAIRKKQSTVKNKTSANKRSKVKKKAVTKTTSKTVTKARASGKPTTATKSSSKKPKVKTRTANSVDGVLADFNKQRTEQETKLVSVRKKIVQLEEKTKAFQAEIVALKSAEATAVETIDSLDIRRDKAVRELLDKLGVKLADEPQVSKSVKSKKKKTTQTKKTKATKTSKSKKKKASAATKSDSAKSDSASTQQKPEITVLPTPLFDTVINDSARSEPRAGSNGSLNKPSPTEFTESSSDELLDDVE